ncbi:MAG: chemotaxis protein CheX [Bacteroidota bacterium]|nr:chemotaxis protein CheX [Bacteroidota bacterium]
MKKAETNLDAKIINPFLEAALSVFEQILKTTPERGKIYLEMPPLHGKEVNAVIGVTGGISGQVIYCVDTDTSIKLASALMPGMPINTFDELAQSAIRELGNMITGNAATRLFENGFSCNLTPPTLFFGKDVFLSTNDRVLVIPLKLPQGEVTIHVAVKEDNK